MDLTTPLLNLLPSLYADAWGSLEHWTQAEIWAYADEAVQRLAREFPLQAEVDTSLATAAGTGEYALPAGHGGVIAVAAADRALRLATPAEMDAYHRDWKTEQLTPQWYVLDTVGTGVIRLALVPADIEALAITRYRLPATLSAAAPTITAPGILQDYVVFAVLESAWKKQGDAQQPEVAEFAGQVATLLVSAMRAIWRG